MSCITGVGKLIGCTIDFTLFEAYVFIVKASSINLFWN